MTEQYQQNCINSYMGSRTVGVSGPITLDDDLVVIASGTPTLTLPDARTIPGKEFSIKSITGSGSISAILGQLIDGASAFNFSEALDGIIVQSDGSNWQIISSEGTTSPRIYDAIVSVDGGGDFLSISEAFNSGAISVFVRSGIYIESDNINLPNGGLMIGESPGSVTIDLSGGYEVRVDGSDRQTIVGTISIATGSVNVIGVGTLFTSLLPGDFILIGDDFYPIISIINDTSLNIEIPYRGEAVIGQVSVGQSMIIGVEVKNIIIKNATLSGLTLTQAYRCILTTVSVQSNNTTGGTEGALLDYCSGIAINSCAFDANGTEGIRLLNSYSIFIIGCIFRDNGGNGIIVEGSRSVILDSSQSLQNSGAGLRVVGGTDRMQINNILSIQNNGSGLVTSPGSSGTVISNSQFISNGGVGVDFDGTANIVDGCLIDGNGSDGINAGDNGSVDGCNIRNNDGIGLNMRADQNCSVSACIIELNISHGILAGSDCTISTNRIRGNGGDGIRLPNTADDSIVTGNRISGNGGNGVNISAAGANRNIVTSNNMTGNIGASFNDSGTGTISANNAV